MVSIAGTSTPTTQRATQQETMPQHSSFFGSPRGIMDFLEDHQEPLNRRPRSTSTTSEDSAWNHVPVFFLEPRYNAINLPHSSWNFYFDAQERNQRTQATTRTPFVQDYDFYSSNQHMIRALEIPSTIMLPMSL